MSMTLDAAAAAMREAMRETVKRHSLWYLIQGALMVIVGVLALIYPLVSSFAVVLFLGWMLIISGIVQGISLFDARNVPHFWLQLVSVVLSLIVGVLFLRDPSQALLAVTLLLIVFLMVEGISKVIFALTIRPFPNWGLGPGERHHWNTSGALPLGQPPDHSDLAAWRVARYPAYLRRGCYRLFGLAGSQQLTLTTSPNSSYSICVSRSPGSRVLLLPSHEFSPKI